MIPDPFHPAVVHFPIALAVLTPLAVAAALLLLRARQSRLKVWSAVVCLQILLAASGWLAHEAGHHEEERVEKVVAERFIEQHEEAADRFLLLAGVGIPIALLGLLRGRAGRFAQAAMLASSLATAAAVMLTGSSGGDLVYRHGASLAYVDKGGDLREARPRDSLGSALHEEDDDDDDDD